MSTIRLNLAEVEVKHGDCVPENKLGEGSNAWTKSYFASAKDDFPSLKSFLDDNKEIDYSINLKKVAVYKLIIERYFVQRFPLYKGKGAAFQQNCKFLLEQSENPIIKLSVRVNDERVFMKFANGRDQNVHALRELLFDEISTLILSEKDGVHEIYPSIIYQNLDLTIDAPQPPQPPPTVDRLSIALKLFAAKRNEEEWFADNTGGNTNKPRIGYIANKQLRVISNTPADIAKLNGDSAANIRAWFKNYWNPEDNKSWLENLDDADLSGFGPYVAYLLQPGSSSVKKPDKFTNALDAAVKAIIKPEETGFYDERINEILNFLGLIGFEWKEDFDIDDLGEAVNAQRVIKRRLKDLDIKRIQESATSDDGNDPDYITVNEFIWFIDTNKDLIMEEVMNKAMKKDKPTPYEGKKDLELKPESKDDELLLRLLASLRAKPFAILAGHSGTGKSRYVKKLAYMTCNAEELRNQNQLPGNYLLLQVKPNWHDSTDLLGFRNAIEKGAYQKTQLIEFIFKAYHFSETPFFLCLDEMNLAPVEQYFAEFLSAMESKEPVPLNDISEKDSNLFELGCEWEDSLKYLKENGFSIPKNLFIVGTVNMDETTNQFSRKVLDRAFTIEMTDVDFTNYGNVTDPSYGDTLKPAIIESLLNGEKAVSALDEEDKKADSSLVKVQKALASTPFAIAYRFANEYTLLKRAIECFDADGKMKLDALDQAVLMKILPRIAGERDYIEKVYGEKENEGLRGALEGKQVSLSKISEILKRAKDTNSLHITFWP